MNCPTDQKPLFDRLINETRRRLDADPFMEPIKSEVAYLSANDDFTFHTHPMGIEYPSDDDIRTTNNLNKEFLCIGIVPTGETICFHKSDGFQREVCRF